MEILITIGYIAICIVFFSLAIAIHEFGHFIVALKLGLRVERFSIGFGPAIWKKTWKGVEYRISWIPLGGYVMIPDVDPEGTKAIEGGTGTGERNRPLRGFATHGEANTPSEASAEGTGTEKQKISPWKEIAVAVAGPGMNIVLAVVLAFLLAAIPSVRFGELPATITEAKPGGPAEKAGIRPGDTVLSVDGRPVATWTEMRVEFQIVGGRETDVVLRDKDGVERTVKVTPERDPVTGMYFIEAAHIAKEEVAAGWMPHRNPLKQLAWDAGSIFRVLKGLVTPKEVKNTANALGGPQMIAESIYKSVRRDFWDGVGFLRYLNVNLAVLNLLPIPVLDGGLIMFALFAFLFRRRVPEKIVSMLSMTFMVLLLGAMAILIFRDAQRSWRIHTYKPPADETAETNTVTTVTNETDNTSN
ncbi:MAG: site-2 protease family protein [Kiritimatiellae bacterium]|nr:site-2 protease family protein [Kiritimatiellia bacterium]